jgi:hypothetical protein
MPSAADGPHLAVAVLCEKVLKEEDGVLSLIRIFDRFTHTQTGPDAPEQMPPFTINAWLVITLKAGAARGRNSVRLVPEAPSGLTLPSAQMPVLFESEDRGVNLVFQLNFQAEMEGLYWFDVFIEDRRLTRVPLRVVYQRVSTGP